MKILLYGINYSPELTGTGRYSGEMGSWLASNKHDVRVITAPPYYPEWRIHPGYSVWRYGVNEEKGLRVIRCPLYVPARPRLLSRLLHLGSFALSSAFAVLAQARWKPDVIIMVAPTIGCAPAALCLSLLTGARSILHIQDYELDAMLGLGMASDGGWRKLVLWAERHILRAFDRVSTISPGMIRRAKEKGVTPEKVLFFPNWSDIAKFQNQSKSCELLNRLGLDPNRQVALYAGNIGEKQGLEIVVEAAELVQQNSDLQFLIVGEGAGKARLMALAAEKGLSNVYFGPLQPDAVLPSLLASADCHLVVQKRGAADSVLPSKLTNILAMGGNAVITADADTSLGQLCQTHPGIAICVMPESVKAIVDGVYAAMALPRRNQIAAAYAAEHLDKDRILDRFLADIEVSRA